MSDLTSFQKIIELWPSREAMAADIPDAGAWTVSKWWQRNTIPSEWWLAVLATDKARDAGLNAELLAKLAAREPAEVRQ